ncbi:phosphotransferase system enzyme I (PtsI) [Clostridium tetanomorphum]|uniref:phosphoenolpyruvate--protein phosphotransferase n=1 Tax=Clostridium tetanomorphum TaxID=1553 RepID=UPI000451FF3A|nr:phosphoenolpyruvate--protein phosphotransferase [Clostridium tetanomorphum]KAJ53443.1 phosphoenolpyruvate-protein phosphotransferase [Clostridium tetanomorphum DSM 665]MBP1865328.1 phosphotransferase system enzyme I (PtsI) [Clostridium tetanomorphum]NRS85251.1 phosphotransferase system enzyme I (PtsI) [Clostridium tetanomorphum]
MLEGISASSGIAIGKALILKENNSEILSKKVDNVQDENERFKLAVEKGKQQLEKTIVKTKEKLGEEKSKIFEAHLLMLDDPEFVGTISSKILNEKVNSEYAVKTTSEELALIFEQLDDDYMRERAADIKDVSNRLINILMGAENVSIGDIEEECIIIAKDLTPSDTAQIDKEKVLGFATEIGGVTSHSAIIARSIGIPAVLGIGKEISTVKENDLLILDGAKGVLIVNPNEETLNDYKSKMEDEEEIRKNLLQYKELESVTIDNRKVEIAANIGSVEDAENAINNGAEGVGLFRTEFLYMSKQELPSEEEQFIAYKEVLQKLKGNPVIIRTLDIGGDKKLSYLPIQEELNPFLGYRAIRLCLDRKDIFKTQLRALLRASHYGKLKIMFPMISSLQELREGKAVLEQCKTELKNEGIAFNEEVEVGIMIEIPSAAVISDALAKEVDFFSIGTNDLIQYTIAVDRMNEKVSYLYDFFNPAVLRLIKTVIDNGHKEGKYVGMCGEMAGNINLIPLLLGMGLDEFSMSASSVLKARSKIRSLKYEDCKTLVPKVMELGTSHEIREFLKNSIQ